MVPVAHAGHWLPYVIPALVVLVAVVVSTFRERRRRDADQAEPPA
jgi:cytochrome c-type biogenesis protein CcmH/NrfF